MLDKTFEWERLVHPTPTDEMITRRKAIVATILSSFDSNKDVKEAFRLVSAAITGLNPTIQADIEYAATLTTKTKEHHQAFPSALTENAMDLQLSASLAVGEVLTRKPPKGAWKDPIALIAGLAVAAHELQPTVNTVHLKTVQEAILIQANELLAREGVEARERPEVDSEALEEFSAPGDLPSFWSSLKPILEDALKSITRASSIDRDELEVLWWLYGDTSATFSKKLSEMNSFDVALASSLELVDRAICPAPTSLKNIIQGLVARSDKKAKPLSKTLKALVSGWTTEVLAALSPDDDDVKAIAESFPKVLPLTWIAIKVTQSGVVEGWEQEFSSRTGLKATLKVTPDVIAEQIFAERTAQRLLLPLCGE